MDVSAPSPQPQNFAHDFSTVKVHYRNFYFEISDPEAASQYQTGMSNVPKEGSERMMINEEVVRHLCLMKIIMKFFRWRSYLVPPIKSLSPQHSWEDIIEGTKYDRQRKTFIMIFIKHKILNNFLIDQHPLWGLLGNIGYFRLVLGGCPGSEISKSKFLWWTFPVEISQ